MCHIIYMNIKQVFNKSVHIFYISFSIKISLFFCIAKLRHDRKSLINPRKCDEASEGQIIDDRQS